MTVQRTPSLAQIIKNACELTALGVHVALPAVVESFDAASQTIDATPQLAFPVRAADGSTTSSFPPRLARVPVVYPGGGGFSIKWTLAPGDTVLLVFADLSIDAWKQLAGAQDPQGLSPHSLANAIAIPGLRSPANPRAAVGSSAIQIGVDGGAYEGVARGGVLDSFLSTLKTWLDAHTHPSNGSQPTAPSPSTPKTSSASVRVTP